MATTKRIFGGFASVCVLAAAVSAGDGKPGDGSAGGGPTTKPVNKYCAVEGEPNEVVADGGTAQHEGKTYGFCCEGCVDEFKKDPAKYAAKAK